MALKIVTADQRMARPAGRKIVIAGLHGIGKTWLARSLDPVTTLVTDMEAGSLALEGWGGTSIPVESWDDSRNLACLIGGPSPHRRPDENYSQAHYDYCAKESPEVVEMLATKIKTVFWDSITEMTRLSLHWSRGQPAAFSEKTGKPDGRGAYGLLATEGLDLFRHLQHAAHHNIIIVGGLKLEKDEYGRSSWSMMVEGGKIERELPGIFDNVMTLAEMKTEDGVSFRALVCQGLNKDGYPAKDRSGRLDMIEEPNLTKLIDKMNGGARRDQSVTSIPGVTVPATGAPPPF